ncbi:MAG: hypothetical protein FJ271_04065 [Planctomycetes bacterium]|nr:hypothetical protein [Planctomycetota bacterium]
MTARPGFDVQGHRGARALKPENTFPSFEVALDVGATSIETDVHLTADDVPVLVHDPWVHEGIFRKIGNGVPETCTRPLVRQLALDQLRGYSADRNPDPVRFPRQNADVTPLAQMFAEARGIDPFTPPTLAELLEFVAAYAGDIGESLGKNAEQRQRARLLRIDLELKRVPFHREYIGDDFDGVRPGTFERRVVEALHRAAALTRSSVRSFDHRCLTAIRVLEPDLATAVLLSGTTPIDPGWLSASVSGSSYCPDYTFLDESQVKQARRHGLRVLPWTVNDADAWRTLLSWGVDGITTDEPGQLAAMLQHGLCQ